MIVSYKKLCVEMARRCVGVDIFDEVSRITIRSIKNGLPVRPMTAGKIAKALGVDVTEILEDI